MTHDLIIRNQVMSSKSLLEDKKPVSGNYLDYYIGCRDEYRSTSPQDHTGLY